MLTKFEEITEDLSEKELKIKDTVLEAFKTALPEGQTYKAPVLLQRLNNYLLVNCPGYVINGVRLRKWCNYICTNTLLPVVATSRGYEVSWDRQKIYDNVQSLRERGNSIKNRAEGMLRFIPETQ